MRFGRKTVVITGAVSGIGRAAVLKFAGAGPIVFAADSDALLAIEKPVAR